MIVLPAGSVLAFQLPSLAARSFKVRVDLSDFDIRAPSVEFIDPWTDLPLNYELMFRALEAEGATLAR